MTMDVALCAEHVLPAKGGMATYISDLARRLARDGHGVRLLSCRWDAAALPSQVRYHAIPAPTGPRFLRPWRFAAHCAESLRSVPHDVSLGFDKTWGQDILYPQGGLHAASANHNLFKYASPLARGLAAALKWVDPAAWSFARLERRQYLGPDRPLVLVNSRMVQGHFARYYGLGSERVRVLYSAIDPGRFAADDRPRRRDEMRRAWGVGPDTPVALFVAMNYRLKGLAPLLRAVGRMRERDFRLVVVGDPRTRRWEALARREGAADRVHFAGFRADPRDAYFGADFLVHPTFYDPCSLVVLEALACGLPAVTTRHNGASELLTPPTDGLVVDDPHDADALAAAMTWFLEPARRSAAAVAARQTAARWTFDDHYRELLAHCADVARRKSAA
jgi:UDP-glucose:(heptosyl)LPS alpha-1,3-glucosyltransferase